MELRVRKRVSEGGFPELRFFDPIAGEDLRTHEESEREVARLRAMLEQMRAARARDVPSDGK